MAHLAYLAPVGPFGGLSRSARQKLERLFPALSLAEVEQIAERFVLELLEDSTGTRLAEARNVLETFGKQLACLESALGRIRAHKLAEAIREAGRTSTDTINLEHFDRCLRDLKAAVRRISRAIPAERSHLASRRLVARLARCLENAGIPFAGGSGDALVVLVDLLFDDLMVGGDARSAVAEWNGQVKATNADKVGALLDLVGT